MLNVFPSLLTYGFFAPTVLRIVVACVFFYLAGRTWNRAGHLVHVPLPLIGAQPWPPYLAALGEAILGILFLVGLYTQVAALLGILGMIKYVAYRIWWPKVLEEYLPISPIAALLITVICVSLLATGAGAIAFDIPL